jgi:hypothetical protein
MFLLDGVNSVAVPENHVARTDHRHRGHRPVEGKMGVRKMGELEGASATGFSSIVGGRNPGKLWLGNIWGASDTP